MRFAGLDPDHALARWGNHDRTIFLPATVFETDDTGRSYRFRPNVRSIWVRNFPVTGPVKAYFQVPDRPELARSSKGTGAVIVDGSTQTTNSWGLRGPEPDLTATWRGIVLGDSYMQGLFVGDQETPTECLKRDLKARLHASVEILNTGHLGYSPEQYYYTFVNTPARFPPQFVVVSLFANDFGGDIREVLEGKGDWEEGCYWLGLIRQYCSRRNMTCLFVPAPWANQIDDARSTGFYPGMVTNNLRATAQNYFDPIADFVNAQLAMSDRGEGSGSRQQPALQRTNRRRPLLGTRVRNSGRRASGAGSPSFLICKRPPPKNTNAKRKRAFAKTRMAPLNADNPLKHDQSRVCSSTN